MFQKSCLQSYSPKLFPKDYFPKLVPEAAPKQRCRELCSKVSSQSCGSLKLLFKATVQSCFSNLPLLPEAAPKNYCPKLLPQSCSSSTLSPKTAPQNYSAKRPPKNAIQSCSPKWSVKRYPKAAPKAAVFQSFCSKLSHKAAPAPQSCSLKPLPKVVIESCSEQLLPKAAKVLH